MKGNTSTEVIKLELTRSEVMTKAEANRSLMAVDERIENLVDR